MSAQRSNLAAASAAPSTTTLPAVGCSSPATISSRVDFPHPLGPTMPVTPPPGTCSDTPSSAATSPNRLVTPESSMPPGAALAMACIPSLA